MIARALAASLALLVGAPALTGGVDARPRRAALKKKAPAPAPATATEAAPAPGNVSVRIIHSGEMAEVELSGTRLRVETTAGGGDGQARTAAPEERQRIIRAALDALGTQDWRKSCGRGEIFVSLTVDGRTGGTAVCAEPRPDQAQWRALLDVLRPMVVARAAE